MNPLDLFQQLLQGFPIEYLLIPLAGIIVLFFLFRELIAWYNKVNKIVRNQNEQSALLEQILDALKQRYR